MLDKASNPLTSKIVAERYEKQAEELIIAQGKYKSQLVRATTTLAKIADVQTKFADNCERLKVEEIFTSNEITREIVGLCVQKIVVDDKSDKIQIILK